MTIEPETNSSHPVHSNQNDESDKPPGPPPSSKCVANYEKATLTLPNCHKKVEKDCHNHHNRRDKQRRREPPPPKLMMTISAQDRTKGFDSLMRWTLISALLLTQVMFCKCEDERSLNNWDRPGGMPKIAHLEVMCGNSHMEVHLAFDKPFNGLVTSKNTYGQQDCIYVPPRTNKDRYVFNIYYDKCGTKPDNHGKFYENTIVVQYDEELIEAWDEAKRLRCEWFNDYEKTATKTSPMVISDLDIVELNFHGDNVDCWMEIQEGKGPWAQPLNGIAPLGSPLTMVIAVKDPSGEFDMRVKECEASDGQSSRTLQLSDPEGCITRPKLFGKFSKVKLDDGKATVLTYAFMSAFKFPDMLNVHLRCTVEICRHGCPNHCTKDKEKELATNSIYGGREPLPASSQVAPSFHKEPLGVKGSEESGEIYNAKVPPQMRPPPPPQPLYAGRPQRAPRPGPGPFPLGLMRGRPDRFPPGPPMRHGGPPRAFPPPNNNKHPLGLNPPPLDPMFAHDQQHQHQQNPNQVMQLQNLLLKPEPKSAELSERSGEPLNSKEEEKAEEKKPEPAALVEKDREMLMEAQPKEEKAKPEAAEPPRPTHFPKGPRNLHIRKRRSVSGPSDVVGVQGLFRVVSQADLNFAISPNNTMTPPTIVLRGKMGVDPVYGICLPRVGFGVVFFGLGLATLVAILIAVFLAYAHYSLQKGNGQGSNVNVNSGPTSLAAIQGQSQPLPFPLFPVIWRKMW